VVKFRSCDISSVAKPQKRKTFFIHSPITVSNSEVSISPGFQCFCFKIRDLLGNRTPFTASEVCQRSGREKRTTISREPTF
jgi:hypothetical protein